MRSERGFAVIGAGDRGRAYTEAIQMLGAGTLLCVCDTDEQRARRLQEEKGFRLWSTSYREAIEADDVDIVVVCTPAFYHPEITEFAADRRKHILCEKPMALDIEGARRMAFAAQRNGVQLALGFQRRYSAPDRKVREIIREGTLGRGLLFYYCWVAEIRPKIAMHDAIRGNNGPIVDMLCHWVDLVRWMTGAEPRRVFAAGFTYGTEREELAGLDKIALDTAAITIQYTNGDVLQASLCWGLPLGTKGESHHFIIGPHGCIRPTDGGGLLLSQKGGEDREITATQTEAGARSAEMALLSDFLSAIERGAATPIGARDGLAALATSIAALRSISEGRVVEAALSAALEDL